jgi:hypothetical protein
VTEFHHPQRAPPSVPRIRDGALNVRLATGQE